MDKPKNCTHPDCFICPYKDCRYDGKESEDIDSYAKPEYPHVRKIKPSEVRYEESEKGKETRKRYRTTDGYKESQKRYRKTDKAKELNRKRGTDYYKRKSNEIGSPLATVRGYLKKYGVNMGKGERIGTVSAYGRINVPRCFLDKIGAKDGDKIVYYVSRGKLTIITVDKAREITEKAGGSCV